MVCSLSLSFNLGQRNKYSKQASDINWSLKPVTHQLLSVATSHTLNSALLIIFTHTQNPVDTPSIRSVVDGAQRTASSDSPQVSSPIKVHLQCHVTLNSQCYTHDRD